MGIQGIGSAEDGDHREDARNRLLPEVPLGGAPSAFRADFNPDGTVRLVPTKTTGDTGLGAVYEARDDGGPTSDGPAKNEPELGGSREQTGEHMERENTQGGDYDQTGALRDRDRLDGQLNELSATLAKLLQGKSDDLDSRVEEIRRDIDDLKVMVNNLVGSGGGQSPGATFQPVAQLSVIEEDVLAAVEDDGSVPHGVFKRLRRMFRGIWALLWRLLSRFRMVKEWSLSGELGPVPLMGKVGVSVTFGR